MPLSPAWAKNVARRVLWSALEKEIRPAERQELANAFQNRCAYCGEPLPTKWHADHLMSVDAGGFHHLSNRVPSCPPCNEGEKRDTEWRQFLAEKWRDNPEQGAILVTAIETWVAGKRAVEPPVSDKEREIWRTEVARVAEAIDAAWANLRRYR